MYTRDLTIILERRRRENFNYFRGVYKGFMMFLERRRRFFWIFTRCIQGFYNDFGAPQARNFLVLRKLVVLRHSFLDTLERGSLSRGGKNLRGG